MGEINANVRLMERYLDCWCHREYSLALVSAMSDVRLARSLHLKDSQSIGLYVNILKRPGALRMQLRVFTKCLASWRKKWMGSKQIGLVVSVYVHGNGIILTILYQTLNLGAVKN